MPTRSFRGWSSAFLLAGFVGFVSGCGGDETGTQVQVDKKKADALTNSMAGYSGYAKKTGKSKGKAESAPAPAPESSSAPDAAPKP